MKKIVSLDSILTAIRVESHLEVQRVLMMNLWKIKNWEDYSKWKRQGRRLI